jgi:transmembrane sensor
MKPSFPQAAADEQASLWAARLDGSVLTADQRSALDAWLAEHPAHRALLSSYCQFSADLEQQLPLISGIRELSAEAQPSLATAQPQPWSRWPLMASVALTAAAAVALTFWLARSPHQLENLATPAAQRQTLTLVDGTRIELNAQTSLQAEIGPNGRHVRLAAGEAFFAVQKDPSRPFVVETPAGAVRVTGTQFNVRAETATDLDVVVTEGTVQVRTSGDTNRSLVAGDHLTSGAAGTVVQKLSDRALDDALAWRQGQIVFAGVPLRDALARFARYHGRGITATPAAEQLRVGGRYSLDDLNGFFAALEEVLHVHVSHDLSGTIQVRLRTEP